MISLIVNVRTKQTLAKLEDILDGGLQVQKFSDA